MHYKRWARNGDPEKLVQRPGRTLFERFHERIVISGDGCWLWTGATDGHGYGAINVEGRARKAYTVAYTLLVGPIPEGLQLDHLCRVRACCNPAHLEPVTSKENARRGLNGVLNVACPHGHPYDEANTYYAPGNGGKRCRECNRERGRARTRAKQSQ